MEGVKQIPKRIYFFFAMLIEILALFFFSIFKLSKPSDSLTSEDINDLRRNRKLQNNGNDLNYKGKRGGGYLPLGG